MHSIGNVQFQISEETQIVVGLVRIQSFFFEPFVVICGADERIALNEQEWYQLCDQRSNIRKFFNERFFDELTPLTHHHLIKNIYLKEIYIKEKKGHGLRVILNEKIFNALMLYRHCISIYLNGLQKTKKDVKDIISTLIEQSVKKLNDIRVKKPDFFFVQKIMRCCLPSSNLIVEEILCNFSKDLYCCILKKLLTK